MSASVILCLGTLVDKVLGGQEEALSGMFSMRSVCLSLCKPRQGEVESLVLDVIISSVLN